MILLLSSMPALCHSLEPQHKNSSKSVGGQLTALPLRERNTMIYKIILKDGTIVSGSIDRETETAFWIDEDRIMGDIVLVLKSDIVSMEEQKKVLHNNIIF